MDYSLDILALCFIVIFTALPFALATLIERLIPRKKKPMAKYL